MLPNHLSLIAVPLLIFAGGCAGPNALRHSRAKYASAVQVTRNEQLLLNLVRLRYRDTPSFLELSSLATQFAFDESAGVSTTIIEKSNNVLGISADVSASERPTASYTPLQGADFVTRLITPIEEESIVLLTRSGWKGERVFRIAVQSLNGLANMRGASGPTPLKLRQSEIEQANKFKKLVNDLEEYSELGILRFNYETVEIPKSAAISKKTFTPLHAVEAAQHGFKIIHPHEQVAIDIRKIKSVSQATETYVDQNLIENVVTGLEKNGLPRPIRVKFDSRQPSNEIPPPQPDPRPLEPELQPGESVEKLFTVVGDDLLFEAARTINQANPKKFRFLSCDVINPDEVILTGTSQKFVMTWDEGSNERMRDLGAPNLSETKEGRYVLQIEPRSLMGAMYFLSHAIRVPLEHQMAQLAVVSVDEFGEPFDWADVTGDLLRVEYSEHKPDCAAVAVKYRGYWFYIDDRDHSSKATFALLMQLFELRASGGAGKGPVLTLPVGI